MDAARTSEGSPRVLVLGAGAQGLASALRLWEQGWDVTVVAQDWLGDTTSAGAGAIWEYPPFQVKPQAKAKPWVLNTFCSLMLAADAGGRHRSGIRLRRSFYLFRSAAKAQELYPLEDMRSVLPDFSEGLPPPGLVREGTFSHCFSYLAPVVNMRRYLSWLLEVVGTLPGVRFRSLAVEDLAGVGTLAQGEGAVLVVNCLGLGSRRVFGDQAMYGVRGDLVYVLAPGAEERYDFAQVTDEDDPEGALTYVVAQGDGIVACAGTSERVAADQEQDAYKPHPDPVKDAEVVRKILARNMKAIPGALRAPGDGSATGQDDPIVVGHWRGLRPQREGGVRLEVEELTAPAAGHGGKPVPLRVVHNYGHGGSGVVTSWGCAADVAALARMDGLTLRPRALPGDLAPLSAAAVAARITAGLGHGATSRL